MTLHTVNYEISNISRDTNYYILFRRVQTSQADPATSFPSGMDSDREVTERLIDQPPCYDESELGAPREQFEVEDPSDENQTEGVAAGEERVEGTSRRWLHSVKKFGEQRIKVPVRYLIDPITNFFSGISMWMDAKLSRWVNPLLATRFFVVFIACVIILIVRVHCGSSFGSAGNLRNHDKLRDTLRSKINLKNLEETTEYFGQMPHYAGSLADDSTSNYVHDFFESLGLPSTYDRHDVFLTHGNETLCELKQNGEVTWSSNLAEGSAIENPSSSQKQPITQMSLVLPGDAEAPLVYANFGSEDDFKAVSVDQNIVLVKYGPEPPGTIAIRAEKLGARGIIFMSSKHPTEPSWPDGSDYPADAVQQGSMGSSSIYPGDILSPGWPSSTQMTVTLSNAYIARIPAAAISWNDAEPLINSLRGSGTRMDDTSISWANNGAPEGVSEWWTGPNPGFTVHLRTQPIVEPRHEIRNVFGHLEGREMDERAVIIGARLDSVCYGSSQLSGLNVMLEVARVFADLKYTDQWEPLRSIYFTAWDGTSLNYAGVTEWVESVSANLSLEGVVYIDLDLGVSGPDFVVQGNPIIQVEDLLKKVAFQDKSLWDAVDKSQSFRPIPGYGNHVAFESHTGVPSVQLGFKNKDKPVPIDSCFDNLNWMSKYGDPDHTRHAALAEIVSYLALDLSDAPLLPFNFVKLGNEIHRYINLVDELAKKKFVNSETDKEIQEALALARKAATDVIKAGNLFEQARGEWGEFAELNKDPDTGDIPDVAPATRARMYWNEKVSQANKATLDRNGIALRNWYKNHLFGPEYDYNFDDELAGSYPAVRDALNVGSRDMFVDTLIDAAGHTSRLAEYLSNILF